MNTDESLFARSVLFDPGSTPRSGFPFLRCAFAPSLRKESGTSCDARAPDVSMPNHRLALGRAVSPADPTPRHAVSREGAKAQRRRGFRFAGWLGNSVSDTELQS